jgi:hypothetical protein
LANKPDSHRILDAIFHLCWSSPPTDDPVYRSYEKRRVGEDLKIGDEYLKVKNFRGAEFRFEDALTYEPNNAEATFKLAEGTNKPWPQSRRLAPSTRHIWSLSLQEHSQIALGKVYKA